jgi:Winged helix DNA-binding domain
MGGMNVTNLIDAVVRQTSVLLAQLATTGGGRAQLANTANQVFLDLVGALREQGLRSRVIADMFGLALRTYQERVRRLSESRTIRGKSLWEAVLEHIQQHGPSSRAQVLTRFRYDDGESVRGVLRDLVNAGVVYRTGRGDGVSYRALESEQMNALARESEEALLNVVHITVQQKGPMTRAELGVLTTLPVDAISLALTELVQKGLLRQVSADDEAHGREGAGLLAGEPRSDEPRYSSSGCVLPFDDPNGWEAAVFDHYQAMVGAVCAKLSLGTRGASLADQVGGSTFGFEIWPAHAHYDEVRGVLRSFREQCRELRERVGKYNEVTEAALHKERVIVYFGQNILNDYSDEQGDEDAQ